MFIRFNKIIKIKQIIDNNKGIPLTTTSFTYDADPFNYFMGYQLITLIHSFQSTESIQKNETNLQSTEAYSRARDRLMNKFVNNVYKKVSVLNYLFYFFINIIHKFIH